VWERNEHAIAADPAATDNIAQGGSSPETVDRKRSDEQHHARSHERKLSLEPRRAKRDLRRGRAPIPTPVATFPGKPS